MSLLEAMKRIQTRIIGQQELMTNENAAISLSVTTLDGFLFDISYKGQSTQVSKGEFKEALRRAKRKGVKSRTLSALSDAFHAAQLAYDGMKNENSGSGD